ncbi:MAG: hypothetical protein MJ252_08260 [archaeon]|nr:hypothetical protein [archaeon]
MVYNSKRKIDSDVNAFKSQKDVFDWDLHTMQKYDKEKKEENQPKKVKLDRERAKKDLYSKDIFKLDEEDNHRRVGKTIKADKLNSDIFGLKEDEPKKRTIRQNPNKDNDIFLTKPVPEKDITVPKKSIKKNHNTESNKDYEPPVRTVKGYSQQNMLSKDNPFCV